MLLEQDIHFLYVGGLIRTKRATTICTQTLWIQLYRRKYSLHKLFILFCMYSCNNPTRHYDQSFVMIFRRALLIDKRAYWWLEFTTQLFPRLSWTEPFNPKPAGNCTRKLNCAYWLACVSYHQNITFLFKQDEQVYRKLKPRGKWFAD